MLLWEGERERDVCVACTGILGNSKVTIQPNPFGAHSLESHTLFGSTSLARKTCKNDLRFKKLSARRPFGEPCRPSCPFLGDQVVHNHLGLARPRLPDFCEGRLATYVARDKPFDFRNWSMVPFNVWAMGLFVKSAMLHSFPYQLVPKISA